MLKSLVTILSLVLLKSKQTNSWQDARNHKYMVCKPIDDVFAPSTTNCTEQISQVKRGKSGPRGERGLPGPKGEPGTSPFPADFNPSRFVEMERRVERTEETNNELKTKINSLERAVERLEEAAYRCQFPHNGYNYTITPSAQSWEESRRVCQNIGGDLAVHGMKNLTLRLSILTHLDSIQVFPWVGLSDLETDGVWKWADGTYDDGNNWMPHEPNGGTAENCAQLWTNAERSINGLFNDNSCQTNFRAICEVKLQPWVCMG